jgi:hypothetical protein
MDVFEIQEHFAGLSFKFLPVIMRIGRFVLIAENIENLSVLAGFYVAIAAISPQVQLDVIARLSVFNGKLLLNLTNSHTPNQCNSANG